MINKVIYDVDGVLLDWIAGFTSWMQSRGHAVRAENPGAYLISERFHGVAEEEVGELIHRFHTSAHYAELPWIPGAARAVSSLRYLLTGSRQIAVTACGLYPQTIMMRAKQLRRVELDELRIVGLNESKAQYFSGEGTLVIEDRVEHLREAEAAGCLTLAFDQPWNQEWEGPRARSWAEVIEFARAHAPEPEAEPDTAEIAERQLLIDQRRALPAPSEEPVTKRPRKRKAS